MIYKPITMKKHVSLVKIYKKKELQLIVLYMNMSWDPNILVLTREEGMGLVCPVLREPKADRVA